MAMSTASANRSFLPEQINELVVHPVTRASVAIQAVDYVSASGNGFRVPVVTEYPSAAWTAEGAEIALSDATLAEVESPYFKLAGLTSVSRELADDSSPAALEIVGAGLANSIAAQLDASFFGTAGTATNQPKGLGDVANPTQHNGALDNLDLFLDAIYGAQAVGAQLGAFVANPSDALAVAKLKDAASSNRGLVQPDATKPGVSLISGVPMLPSPAVAAGTIWGLPSMGKVIIAVREGTELRQSEDAYFNSDRVAVRATMRVAFLFPHEAAIQKITVDPGKSGK